jgi:hypothetical protein
VILNRLHGGFHDADPARHLLTIAFCVLAYNLAIYALPFAAGLTAFQYAYAAAAVLMSGLAAIGAALGSIALVIAVVGFAPALRLSRWRSSPFPPSSPAPRLSTASPTHDRRRSCPQSGVRRWRPVIGIAAMLNLYAVGTAVLSR